MTRSSENSTDVLIVSTGTANLASVVVGLERVGARPRISSDPAEVARARRLVLPGVGTLGAAMSYLQEQLLLAPVREWVAAGRPTLAICLGFQLLLAGSDETPGLAGLGLIEGRAERFDDRVRVPQLGWNRLTPDDDCRLLGEGYAYFANSYRLQQPPPEWGVASADYGGRFVAAVEKGAVLACQFHPELSGTFGLGLLESWLGATREKGVA